MHAKKQWLSRMNYIPKSDKDKKYFRHLTIENTRVMNSTNISIIEWYPDPPFFGSIFSILLIICAFLGLLSSMAIFNYIVFFLKLNQHLKVILGLYAIELILCFGTVLVLSLIHI